MISKLLLENSLSTKLAKIFKKRTMEAHLPSYTSMMSPRARGNKAQMGYKQPNSLMHEQHNTTLHNPNQVFHNDSHMES